MPSPGRKAAVNGKKEKVRAKANTGLPSRARSARIKTNAEIKQEPVEDEKVSVKKKVNLKKAVIKPKGKTFQAASSVKEKAKKIASSKKRRDAYYSANKINPKMTVLALAAARKRKLNGEDDEEVPRKRNMKKKGPQRRKIKKKVAVSKVSSLAVVNEFDDFNQDEEILEEEGYDGQTMIAIKQEDENQCNHDEQQYEEEFEGNEENNLLIHEEHQYIDQINRSNIMEDHGGIEVSQDQVQAELQNDDNEDEDEADDDEDIDENLFFGIPEQQSPDLATCTHCKGKFRKEDVHEHMLTCPERYVQCRECGKILSNLQTLERHHKRFHLKIREVPCTLCDKMFIDEAAARKHLKTVHFKVKNFHCPHCDKSFSQRNKLTYHVRTHSGEKPYSCAECGRSFSLLWNLKTHLRTHTGEKPYACDTCGRRFTQKQNMTSHLTTHRKPKSDKSFRAQFQSELDDYDSHTSDIISTEFSSVKPKNNYRSLEQAKQLGAQSIGSSHYVLGDMQSIEVHTADDQGVENTVNLEHGLGLLSSVARKGDSTDVQVDGIVNIPENQLGTAGGHLDQVVEVLIRSNGDTDKASNSLNNFHFSSSSQSKIIVDPNTQAITDGDGHEITMDTNTAAGLANILQNPDVLAAINSAASTNKFIVIGPVSMFDGSTSQVSDVVSMSSSDAIMASDVTSTFSQEQLAQISSLVAAENDIDSSQVSSQTVNDSISATTALAAVENYLQGEQPSSTLGKTDQVVNNILGSIQPDGKRGPTGVLQSAHASMPRSSNLTIAMPPMPQSTLIISPSTLSINADSTQSMKSIILPRANGASSSEVSSSVDHVDCAIRFNPQQDPQVEGHMEAESTTETEYPLPNSAENIEHSFVQTRSPVLADSSDMVDNSGNEATSSGEPILMLINDENGQPQIIVKMPDGTETIMSDPALAESLIQVPTITNAEMVSESELNEAEPSQSMVIDEMGGTIQLQLPDQGIPQTMQLPSQSDLQPSQSGLHPQHFSPAAAESSRQELNEEQQLPDQSLDSTHGRRDNDVHSACSRNGNDVDSVYSRHGNAVGSVYSRHENDVDSSSNVDVLELEEADLISDSNMQTPDSSSQSLRRIMAENHIDSRQAIFVMEHVSASDQPEQSHIAAQSHVSEQCRIVEQSDIAEHIPEQSHIGERNQVAEQSHMIEQSHITDATFITKQNHLVEQSHVIEQSHIAEQSHMMKQFDIIEQNHATDQNHMVEQLIEPSNIVHQIPSVEQSDDGEQNHLAEQSHIIEQSDIYHSNHESTDFTADSSSGNPGSMPEPSYLQLHDVTQSSHVQDSSSCHNSMQIHSENVSSTEQNEN